MRIAPASADAFTIFDAPNAPNRGVLDPINVITQDLGAEAGRLIIECYGRAWSCYWGAMGCASTREFMQGTSAGYVLNCLLRGNNGLMLARAQERDEQYLGRVVEAVFKALREGVPA